MHQNPAFRQTGTARNIAFARDRGFGILTLAGASGPLASHIPFVLSQDGNWFEAHILRSNPIWKEIETPQPALLIVSGADGYVSPDWYGMPDQVPTWNYVAVHLRGELHRRDRQMLPAHAARLSAVYEDRLKPKVPWTQEKMNPDTLERMRHMIVPVGMKVTTIEGTWKLNQNKEDAARMAAAEMVEASTIGSETAALAALMRDPPVD